MSLFQGFTQCYISLDLIAPPLGHIQGGSSRQGEEGGGHSIRIGVCIYLYVYMCIFIYAEYEHFMHFMMPIYKNIFIYVL